MTTQNNDRPLKTLEFLPGTRIEEAASQLCKMAADCIGSGYKGDFNGCTLVAFTTSVPQDLVDQYHQWCKETSENYCASPEGAAEKARREAEYQAALNAPPRAFAVRIVLTATTGILLTKRRGEKDNGMGDLYDLVNFALATSVSSLGIPKAIEELKPKLLQQHPELEIADIPCLDSEEKIVAWIDSLRLAPFYLIRVCADNA